MRNPFRPTFGASPHHWAGRRVILEEFAVGLDAGPGDPHRSVIIGGARGIGKTVLLTELEELAAVRGWIVLRASGRGDTVDELIHSTIPRQIAELSPPAGRKITGLGVTGIGRIETDLVDTPSPAPTLGSRLRELLGLLSGAGVMITIDEVQDADPDALAVLATSYQDLVRDDADVALVMAGLSFGISGLLDLPGTTFLRRARRYDLGPLTDDDAAAILTETSRHADLPMTEHAVADAVTLAQGYPYLVQLVGYLAFAAAAREGAAAIGREHVASISDEAVQTMGAQIHHPSLKGVPAAQLNYLTAMSDLAATQGAEIMTADIAAALGKTPNATTDTRSKLLDRGLIDAAGWGKVSFALPYFAEFLRSGGRVTKVN